MAQTRGRTPSPAGNSRDAGANDVSDKALITKSSGNDVMAAAALNNLAKDYYNWRNENYPVASSDAGLHTWDDRLTDYSPAKMSERAQHEHALLEKVRALKTENWPKDLTDRLDPVSLPVGRRRFLNASPQVRAHQPSGLCRRMHERDLLPSEKRIRHAG